MLRRTKDKSKYPNLISPDYALKKTLMKEFLQEIILKK